MKVEQCGANLFHEQPSGVGDRHTAGCPIEQADTEAFLEFADRMTERGGGHSEVDYLASYAGERFLQSVAFVRRYPQDLPRIAARLAEIETPAQIIVGRHDPYVPVSNAQGLLKGLPKSKLDILDCGHFEWDDGAPEYGRLAAEWIKGGYALV
jgi:pimeloyl-ACP methyl ester carboxylesterase